LNNKNSFSSDSFCYNLKIDKITSKGILFLPKYHHFF